MHLFGPTIRLKQGGTMEIYLANDLLVGEGPEAASNSFRDPAGTNLHTHGLHDSPGG